MSYATRNAPDTRQQPTMGVFDPDRMAKVAFVASLRGEELHRAVADLSAQEALDVVENPLVSRAVRIALVMRLDDPDMLVRIATGNGEMFVRRDALERLDALLQQQPLSRSQLETLTVCLREGSLLSSAVTLMESAGFDWCAYCDEAVCGALCHALYNCHGIQEEVVVEDAFSQLAHCRPDLAPSLRKCSPERFLPLSMQPPLARTIALTTVVRRDDVA